MAVRWQRWWKRYRVRLGLGLLALMVTVPVSAILKRALEVWGIFNPIGDLFGGWLRQHVSPSQAEWTVAALISLILYAVAIAFIARRPTKGNSGLSKEAHQLVQRAYGIGDPPPLVPSSQITSDSPTIERGPSAFDIFRREQTLQFLRGRPLQIEIGENGAFFETSGRGSLYTHQRTIKIRINNTSRTETLSACKVQVMDISPHEYDGPWLLQDGFTLAAGDHVFVPLASYTEPDEIQKSPYGATFIEVLANKNRPKPSAKHENILTIRATAIGSPFCEAKCRLWIDENGHLRIEDANVNPKSRTTNRTHESTPNPNDPETFIKIESAALEAFTRIDGTDVASELIRLGRTQDGILRLTIWQLIKSGYAWGYRWPKFNDFVYLDKRAFVGLSVINNNGDMGTTDSDKPLIVGLHVKREGIDAYVDHIYNAKSATPVQRTFDASITTNGILAGNWIFEYARDGRKNLTFNVDGTIGLGRNDNEYQWEVETSGTLAIWRRDGSLQNRFRYDESEDRLICTNDTDAVGNKNQIIYRPSVRVSG